MTPRMWELVLYWAAAQCFLVLCFPALSGCSEQPEGMQLPNRHKVTALEEVFSCVLTSLVVIKSSLTNHVVISLI